MNYFMKCFHLAQNILQVCSVLSNCKDASVMAMLGC